MTDSNETVNILASPAAANRISRRLFMAGGVAAGVGASALLSACGDDTSDTNAGATTSAGPIEDALEMFTWGEYNSPKVIKQFEEKNDLKFTLSSYNSNEQLIAKLTAAKGTSGYDIIVPTGPFVPALVQNELVQPLDLDRIPNFKNLEVQYTDQPWDPGNAHSVCKDWGTTGYVYDTTKISAEMATWQDFLDVAMGEASGQVSVLDTIRDPNAIDPHSEAHTSEVKDRLADAIESLPDRERLVVALYYYENLTLREIGEVLGVTESRVSQLHTKAVLALRSRFPKP